MHHMLHTCINFCDYISNALIKHGSMCTPHTNTTMQLPECFHGNALKMIMRGAGASLRTVYCVYV